MKFNFCIIHIHQIYYLKLLEIVFAKMESRVIQQKTFYLQL